MIGAKSQSRFKPQALGITLQSSTYGSTIPVIYGRTKTALYLIWQANLRTGGASGKKGKSSGGGKKGKSQTNYQMNVDFLIGHNPIISPLQFWENQSTRLPLNFTEYSVAITPGASSFTVSDSNFYCVLGVTLTVTYNADFDDYGAQAGQTLSGTYEIPLWNAAFAGPNLVNETAAQVYPYTFVWQPGSGASIEIPQNAFGALPAGTLNIYYAQLNSSGASLYNKSNSGTAVPAAALRLQFESILGSGSEYSGYSAQQIHYPHYAGLGSPNLDLGSSTGIPAIVPEILGSFPVYPSGDADFADMVEDIFRIGAQSGYGAVSSYTPIQHGLNCGEMPGTVQKKNVSPVGSGYSLPATSYDRANTAGNFLIVCVSGGSGTPGISDTAGNSWTPVFGGSPSGYQIWYAIALAAQSNAVTITNMGTTWQVALLELAGVDTLDSVVSAAGSSTQEIATTNSSGTSGYLLVFSAYATGSFPTDPQLAHWPGLGLAVTPNFILQRRTVPQPGGYSLTNPGSVLQMAILAFKSSQPVNYPKPLGDILDSASLQLTRAQCRANGLYGSLVMDSQQSASDWLGDLYTAMNAAPVWSGFKLKSIPWSEVSTAGNGAIYNAPCGSGPVANLGESDFIGDASQPLITIERKAQVDVPNLLQIQFPNRSSDYNDVVVSQPETAAIALYGPRKDSPKQMRCVQDTAVARMILGIMVRRQNYIRNSYKFKLLAKWKLLEPMDLVTITDSQIGVSLLPVRLTSMEEDENYNLDCEAEPFLYGTYAPLPPSSYGTGAPAPLPVTTHSPYQPQVGVSPGSVNAPVFVEPIPRLSANVSQLWIAVSGASASYGGCQVYLSTDGGASYNSVGTLTGSALTGVLTADWPAAADEDVTNNLSVDLTESNGALASYQTSDEDNFVYPCYVAGGGSSAIPYELMSYAVATLTASYKYTLIATGTGHHLRRAVFGAPSVGAGVDHPVGSRFAFLGPQAQGILKLAMDPLWIGKTLYFKFLSFNTYMSAVLAISGATAYPYTPSGVAQGVSTSAPNATQTPASALTNPTATTIAMAAVSMAFPTNTVHYNARTFTIAAPSVATTYYVTIADPGMLGDSGTSTTLTASCQTSAALVGAVGSSYIGSIQALPAGGGTIIGPGGLPAGQLFLVNGS